MNLYLVSQAVNNEYDTFSAFVMVAPDEETARNTNPYGSIIDWEEQSENRHGSWCWSKDQVNVRFLGVADVSLHGGHPIICASFHAG